MTILLSTEEVQEYLHKIGFTRDDSEPYSIGVGYSDGHSVIILDESYAWQDIDFLIEDMEISKAFAAASYFKNLKVTFEAGYHEEKRKND